MVDLNAGVQMEASPAAELFSPKTQQAQAILKHLTGQYETARRVRSGPSLLDDLDVYEKRIIEGHRYFSRATQTELTLTYASEWVLDNFYIIRQAIRQIREDLPPGYYRQLPRLAGPVLAGYPRIYAIARETLAANRMEMDEELLQLVVNGFQESASLTMGEIWALPIFLRFAAIEALAQTLTRLMPGSNLPPLPNPPPAGETNPDENVANSVLSLRTISELDWKVFFESTSRVEQGLRGDPAGVYARMDFKTRDLYRAEVERVALAGGMDENTVVAAVLSLARQAEITGLEQPEHTGEKPSAPDAEDQAAHSNGKAHPREAHVGYFLIAEGRDALEKHLEVRLPFRHSLRRWVLRHNQAVYFTADLGLALAIILLLSLYAALQTASLGLVVPSALLVVLTALLVVLTALLLLLPALTVSTSLVNWLITVLLPPTVLPKLEIEKEIPAEMQTLVVVPCLLTSKEEITSLVQQIEQHYLRNPEPGLFFGLVSDFADADEEHRSEDEALVEHAGAAVQALNEKYPRQNGFPPPFFLFHRRRLWNPVEGKWMGWERKRGKLHELNRLLRGARQLSFSCTVGSLDALRVVRYVITLDADTILPAHAAARMIGAMAHPLNRPVFNPEREKVTAGYTILQPRMEISPTSGNRSLFTRIFAGDTGLDLYSRAVSDAYQDFFGEGIYVGKGIYDVDGFERSTAGCIPENTLLSHDLLEGLLGRAGLVTDITMIEDYPPHYFISQQRQHRWIRGDWQLLPWLIQPNRHGVTLTAIDRWKVIDNLRRSLLAPGLMALLIFGWLVLPGSAWVWTAAAVLSLAIPVLTGVLRGATGLLQGEPLTTSVNSIRLSLVRWVLAVAFLPYEAYQALDAIGITLYRILLSRRRLLEWTTAAQATHLFSSQKGKAGILEWQEMGPSFLLTLALAALVYLLNPPALPAAALILLAWLLSPLITEWINRPLVHVEPPLAPEQVRILRSIARRTWSFFERFAGPEDHWLPPDHFQESPLGVVAHRTSPSNIGLMLTSTLAAYDLGYIDLLGMVARLTATFETLEGMERYRGHFINWYDTVSLQPLHPRYVSTVDSGNLAACLIITAQACESLRDTTIFRSQNWEGYQDILAILEDALGRLAQPGVTIPILPIRGRLQMLNEHIDAIKNYPERWYALFSEITTKTWPELSQAISQLLQAGRASLGMETLHSLQQVATQVERQHVSVARILAELVPWTVMLHEPPAVFQRTPELAEAFEAVHAALPGSPVLSAIHTLPEMAYPRIDELRARLTALRLPKEEKTQALDWIENLSRAVLTAAATSNVLITALNRIRQQALETVREMDFRFLYNPDRRIFHIGYNLDSAMLDRNYYDLLASEARIASLIAIAKGEVSQQHWVYLNRPVTEVNGLRVLLSWSATMFEYLMPPLFLRSYKGTLLDDSTRGAVQYQIQYAQEKGVPWGISESGFYRFDANQSYQYRAFGVPGLGFKRGLGDDLVIAPYASLMAIPTFPQQVYANIEKMIELKLLGLYGFYESADFTRERLGLGDQYAIVAEYMSHHQGMILLALANYLCHGTMIERMHSNPAIRSVELLLQEQVPASVTNQGPEEEESKGIQRMVAAPVELFPWPVPVQTPVPQANLISNGSYTLFIDNAGAGYSRWNDTDLTRWQPDAVTGGGGTWIYLQERGPAQAQRRLWSAGFQPVPGSPDNFQVTFHPHMVVYRRDEANLVSTLEVTVAPDDPLEIRRLHLTNNTDRPLRLRLTSYGEVILAQQAVDARHPAFNKMFIESEYLPEQLMLAFKRRPRSDKEKPIYLGHMLIPLDTEGREPPDTTQAGLHFETDRYCFTGRGQTLHSPAALASETYLTGSAGATLDPIFALGHEVDLPAHGSYRLAYLTFAATSREELIDVANRYRAPGRIERAFNQADLANQSWLGQHNTGSRQLRAILESLSALVFPSTQSRAPAETLAANRLGQPGLWRFGISGDFPILLVRVEEASQLELVREIINTHRFLRARRFFSDLVILNQQHTNYGAELNGLLYRLAARTGSDQWLNQRGGIFILYQDQMNPGERTLLETASRLVFTGANGAMTNQLPGYSVQVFHLPELLPTRPPRGVSEEDALPPLEELRFANGYGGFTPDGREYVIDLPGGTWTPAPWTNVIGYPGFGFLVTESGSSCTWAENSGENRLTPWSNDPVSDPSGEALYLRDEETAEVWTPTPLPVGTGPYRARHGAGYTTFEHASHGLSHHLRVFAVPDAPLKVVLLRLENRLDTPRRITATQYVEWVLGTTRAATRQFIVPEYDTGRGCLLAVNSYNSEFGERVAFLAASKTIHGLTADRAEFLGRNGSLESPAALRRIGLETRVTPGEDPCGVLQLHIDLPPGGVEEVYFLVGQGANREEALALVDRYQKQEAVEAAWQAVGTTWERLLGAVQVRTPDPALDIILNRWLLYQALSCRIWGRSAFYQSSGAFGFRDQLQDVLAVLATAPEIARKHILESASHQFEAGDVLHWWHPPSARGVRTRFSDDLLWLPYVVSCYVETTGDWGILDEVVPYLTGPALKEGEEERYGLFAQAENPGTLFEHCRKAIERGATSGPHRLPLIGSGDWNDGMNRVGTEGRGESVWLAWFLSDVLQRFARICERRGENRMVEQSRARAGRLAQSIEASAWDGQWYRRAYFDDGTPLGSARNKECQIDSIAQSWAVLSGAGDPTRARQAMQAVLDRLVRPEDRLILLFTPPFDQTELDPGYIKGYLPGIRENGGQYTHASTWTAWAMARLGDGKTAGELVTLLNPVYQSDTKEKAQVYRVEPYVIAADVYSVPPYIRRGGWTWYTGSSGWMYRLGLEALLGFHKEGDTLWVDPAIPPEWDGFEIDYRHGDSLYHIILRNPQHVAHGVRSVTLNGAQIREPAIPIEETGGNHTVEIVLGAAAGGDQA